MKPPPSLSETEPLYTRLRAEQQYTARLFLFAGAHAALARGEFAAASSLLNEARALLAKVNNETDPAWRVYHSYAARLALGQRRFPHAEQSASAALRLSQLQAIDPDASIFVGEDLLAHAQALARLGDATRARPEAKRAMTLIETVAGEKHPLHDRARAGVLGSLKTKSRSASRLERRDDATTPVPRRLRRRGTEPRGSRRRAESLRRIVIR